MRLRVTVFLLINYDKAETQIKRRLKLDVMLNLRVAEKHAGNDHVTLFSSRSIFCLRLNGGIHRPSPHCACEMRKRSFVTTVRPTIHNNPPRKQSFSKTLFKSEEFENTGFALLKVHRTENMKTKVFENDGIATIICFFLCQNFP